MFAQDACAGYRIVSKVVYDQTPVKMNKWINETTSENQIITTYKPVWKTEHRERQNYVLKPVRKTSMFEEKYIVQRPVIETSYRERQIEETVYETVTELRDQDVVVETPVYETEMRDEKIVVRRPVTETMYKTESVTAYRPTIVSDTQLVPANLYINQLVPSPYNGRFQPRWLAPGYYVDPVTGMNAYRRRGFHWIQNPAAYQFQIATVPALAAQRVDRLEFVPEIVQTQKPVEVTRYVEAVENRKVPIKVEKTLRRIESRKVPVTVERPKTVLRKEFFPYTTTRYVDEVRTRKIPVTETTYELVQQAVPYEVKSVEWVAVTQEIEVPKVRPRLVQVDLIKHTPRTVMMKVPIDAAGNVIGPAEPLFARDAAIVGSPTLATPLSQIPPPVELADEESAKSWEETSSSGAKSILEKTESGWPPYNEFRARPVLRIPENGASETSSSDSNSKRDYSNPKTKLTPIWRPPAENPKTQSASILDGDLPRATKPTRSRDSDGTSPADKVSALESRPSSSTPPDINGPAEKDDDEPF